MSYQLWLGPCLMLLGSLLLAIFRISIINQDNVYKNIKTGEYFKLICGGEGIWLRPKKVFLKFWFIDKSKSEDIQVSHKTFHKNYIKVK